MKPALFSSNSEGACPSCNGAGVIYTELGIMNTVESTCEECEGRRFQASVLEYTLGGRNIAEVLAMPVTEALEFFDEAARAGRSQGPRPARRRRSWLCQPGPAVDDVVRRQRQRLKLATQMGEKGETYILDEPTTGLHLADVEQLLGLLDRLVDSGKSVIVIEHHQAVMAHADWIIDLGPGAGHDGGRIVFEGTPEALVAERSTLTGQHLAAYVGTWSNLRVHRVPALRRAPSRWTRLLGVVDLPEDPAHAGEDRGDLIGGTVAQRCNGCARSRLRRRAGPVGAGVPFRNSAGHGRRKLSSASTRRDTGRHRRLGQGVPGSAISTQRAASSSSLGSSSSAAVSVSPAPNSRRRLPPVIAAGSTPSQTLSSASNRPAPSANTCGQALAGPDVTSMRAHFRQAGTAKESDLPPR